MCGKYGIVCLTTSDFDEERYPIPPKRVVPSMTECNHTPMPDGYLQWHEWARQAHKTHRQIRCPKCGGLSIWLPKAEATEINRRDAKERAEFLRGYRRYFALQQISEAKKVLKSTKRKKARR